jgi:hypothetical protein
LRTNLLGDGDAVVHNLGRAVLALEHHVPAFGSQRDAHEVRELVDSSLTEPEECEDYRCQCDSTMRFQQCDPARTCILLMAEPSLLKWSSLAAFTVTRRLTLRSNRHFVTNLMERNVAGFWSEAATTLFCNHPFPDDIISCLPHPCFAHTLLIPVWNRLWVAFPCTLMTRLFLCSR